MSTPAVSISSIGVEEASPFGIPVGKFTLWLFLVADALLFAGFLASYGFIRVASQIWPKATNLFNIHLVAFMTFVLISSSCTMACAVSAAVRQNFTHVFFFLLVTALGGITFLGMQVYEWSHFIREGARLGSNPWGVPLFSASFFVITGFHGLHVLSGVLLLAGMAWVVRKGKATSGTVENIGLYWHFIDLVWVFIFALFYLL